MLPVYKEEAASEEGVRVVFSSDNLECCSDMAPDHIDGLVVQFPDGSSADLKTRTIVNYGGGIIKIREVERDDSYQSDLAERVSQQVDEVLQSADINKLENLGEIISARVNQALRGFSGKNSNFSMNAGATGKPGELAWNGSDIDSLDVSVTGSADVTIHSGTPGQWSVIARGSRDFLNSLRCIEDGNVLKLESQPYKSTRVILGGSRNTIDICTGFTQGVDLDAKVRGSGDLTCEPIFQSSRVSVSGSGDIDLTDAGNLTCAVSGSGGVELGNVELQEMSIGVTGSGDVSVAGGQTDRLELKLHGSSDFDGRNLTVGELVAELNGPADAVIGRLLGKSVERVNRIASLRILSRG